MVEDAAYLWPLDPMRMIQAAVVLNDNKFTAQALSVVVDVTKKFPDNYTSWAILNEVAEVTAEQKAEALVQMKRLDPLNPNLK